MSLSVVGGRRWITPNWLSRMRPRRSWLSSLPWDAHTILRRCSGRLWGEGRFDSAHQAALQGLAECAELLGFDIHVQTDYGDEFQGLTPWELFDAQEAGEALSVAEEAVSLAQALVQAVLP